MIRSASGSVVPKNGSHINAWIHLHDIVGGWSFALERRLQGVYNLVDDLQLSRRDLSNALCEEAGLAPVIWETMIVLVHVCVQCPRQQCPTACTGLHTRIASMLEPIPVV